MFIVVFRAKVRHLDAEYSEVARRMRELALGQYGCLEFQSVSEGDEEVSLSFWPDEESIQAWKEHPEHLLAQKEGRERWYQSYSVHVAQIAREYRGGE
jgi:heme-degrading monooxygenase HmoA